MLSSCLTQCAKHWKLGTVLMKREDLAWLEQAVTVGSFLLQFHLERRQRFLDAVGLLLLRRQSLAYVVDLGFDVVRLWLECQTTHLHLLLTLHLLVNYLHRHPQPRHPPHTAHISAFVSDIAIFVLKRDVKLQLTNTSMPASTMQRPFPHVTGSRNHKSSTWFFLVKVKSFSSFQYSYWQIHCESKKNKALQYCP